MKIYQAFNYVKIQVIILLYLAIMVGGYDEQIVSALQALHQIIALVFGR